MTFSIVAVDVEAKEVGLAIASCCWDAGQVCRAEPETGAIASQAQGNVAFLQQFFDGLAEGKRPNEILADFRASDPEIESRQIGMVAFAGATLAFTGAKCTPWAGHRLGESYAIQGNTLAGPQVVAAMEDAFLGADGPLFARLYAALASGDAAGGDVRGRQSARLAVRKRGFGQPGSDTLVDISIEDHAQPVAELGRILDAGKTLLEILQRFQTLARAEPAERPARLHDVRVLLDDKRDCRYLDWWEALGMAYHEAGDLESAAQAFQVYLEINPALRPALEASAEIGTFPGDLAARLFAPQG